MNRNKKRVIRGDDLRSDEAIDQVFQSLMDFPEWNGKRMDEWIDMISLSNPQNRTVPHLRAQEPEHFALEIQGADLSQIPPQQVANLVRRVAQLNKRYQERMGTSIISLIVS